jgi:hypothetical protein
LASVLVLVATPAFTGLDVSRGLVVEEVARPATVSPRVGPVSSVDGPVVPRAPVHAPARARRTTAPPSAHTPVPLPVPIVDVCTEGPARVCAGTAPTVPARPGDTLYVVLPFSVVGGADATVYAHQEALPLCDVVPATPQGGCQRGPDTHTEAER